MTGFCAHEGAGEDGSSRGFHRTFYSTGHDPSKTLWDGASTSFLDATSLFSANDARPLDELPADLKSLVAGASYVYVDTPGAGAKRKPTTGKSLLRYLAGGARLGKGDPEALLEGIATTKRRPLAPLVGAMRNVKSEFEQRVMRKAADVSGVAHAKVRDA